MNNFIQDNFNIGDSIKVNCNGRYIEGILVNIDDFYLEVKDNSNVIHHIQGNITQNFREIQTSTGRKVDSSNKDGERITSLESGASGIIHETETEKRMKSGLKILGKINIESSSKSDWSIEKAKNGYLPYDGEIKVYKDDWDFCFVTDYSRASIDRIHLKLTDFLDAKELDKENKLKKRLPVHFFLFQDNSGYHAHVAFHKMPVEKFLEECRNGEFEREKEESETYVAEKIDSLIKSGASDAAFALILRIVSDKYSDEEFNRKLVAKQIDYAHSVGDNKIAISAYNLLMSSTPRMSKKEQSSIYYEIAKLQMADDMDREVLEITIQNAIDLDPQNLEAKELKKLILQMPRKEQHNDNDLLLDEEDELLLPSVLISKDSDAIDAFGDLINDSQNSQLYRQKATEYAIRRGNSFYDQFKNNIRHAPKATLEQLADSAISFYTETLRISILPDEDLLNIVTKILLINRAVYYSSQNDKPVFDGKLNQIIKDALSGSDEGFKAVVLKFLISIGAKSGSVWNRLLKMKDGFEGLYKLAFTEEVRTETYELIDALEGNILEYETPLTPYEYLRATIEEKRRKKQALRDMQPSINLDVMAMNPVAESVSQIEPLIYVLPVSDVSLYQDLLSICELLFPYKTALPQQRLDILHDSRRKLDDCMNRAATYPTYFGRSFFYPIFTRWRSTLSTNIDSRTALLYPKFNVKADPAFITKSDRGTGVGIIIQNIGKSESFGYQMTYTFTTETPDIKPIIVTSENSEQIAPEGKISQFVNIPDELTSQESVKLEIDISAKAHGKVLKAEHFAWTLTEEISANELMNIDSIKWSINVKAQKEMFKGRNRDIMELWEHYTTISEMDRPVILYGLTRMGKSSILTALAERIKGTPIELDGQELIIMPFFWELNDIAKQDTENGVWNALLYQRLYLPLLKYSSEIDRRTGKPYDFKVKKCPDRLKAQHFEDVLASIREAGVYPMIFVDEYSYMRDLIAGPNKTWNLGVGFAQTLRDYSFNRKASFIYAGTYDVRDLVKDERYGCLGGAYTGYIQRHVSGIDREPAEELMRVMEPDVQFTGEALSFLHTLSGDVPFFVQMICMNCAKYAIANHRRIIGFPELQYVADILTSHQKPTRKNYIVTPLSDMDFMGNLLDPTKQYEQSFYSCIVKLAIVRNNVTDYVSQSDISAIWSLNKISENEQEMKNARDTLLEKQILEKVVDEDEVYFKIKVDLFRRWWSKHKEEDINYLRKE